MHLIPFYISIILFAKTNINYYRGNSYVQTVYDKDTFTVDDKMGDADIDIKPYLAAIQMGLSNLPNGCAIKRIQPGKNNCLADESSVVWNNGKITQDMRLKLRNVECGEVGIQLEWIEVPGCKGLGSEGTIIV